MATEDTTVAVESNGNALVAALLSGFIPGVGHYYAGLKGRGIYWLVGYFAYIVLGFILSIVGIGLLMLLATPLLNFISAVDAYVQSS